MAVELLSFPQPPFPAGMMGTSYGLGWMLETYRGRSLIYHDGATIGHAAIAAFLPAEQIGIAILSNSGNAFLAQMETLLVAVDIALGEQPWLNSSTACTFPCPWAPTCKTERNPKKAEQKERVPAAVHAISADLNDYVGFYSQPTYGSIQFYVSNNKLNMQFGDAHGIATQQSGDIFVFTVTAPAALDPVLFEFQFLRDLSAVVVAARSPLEPNTPAIVFTTASFKPWLCGYPGFEPTEGEQPHK